MDLNQELVMRQIGRSSKSVHRDFHEQLTQRPLIFPRKAKTPNTIEQPLNIYAMNKPNTDDRMISGHVIRRSQWESPNTDSISAWIDKLPSPRSLLRQRKSNKQLKRSLHEDVAQHLRDLRMKKAKYYETETTVDTTKVDTHRDNSEAVFDNVQLEFRSDILTNYETSVKKGKQIEGRANDESFEFERCLAPSEQFNTDYFFPMFSTEDNNEDKRQRRHVPSPLFFMNSEE